MFAIYTSVRYEIKRFGQRLLSASTNIKPSFEDQKIAIGKYNINYMKVGHGPHHVLCIPGSLGTIWTDFKHQVEGFDREKFTLVAWDPPGFGKSRPPARDFTIDHQRYDAIVAQELMAKLNISKYSIIGYSSGSVPAILLASWSPDSIQKLVLSGAQCFVLPSDVELYHNMKVLSLWSHNLRAPLEEIYGKDILRLYCESWIDSLAKSLREKNGDICSDALPGIECPTLLFWGGKDPLVGRDHVQYIHKHIKNSRIHYYPEGKHNIHIRYYEDFNKRTEDFLLSDS